MRVAKLEFPGYSLGSEFQKNFENILKLAFKAQSQARCTAETLALIKNPAHYIRQAKISQGHQQVNNGYPRQPESHAGQSKKSPIEILEVNDGNRLDTRATTAAGGIDSRLEAVGADHRP